MRTLTVGSLPYLLAQVTGHQHPDDTIPTLAGIRLEADATHLYAIATDRYTIAVARTALGKDSRGSEGFAGFLSTTDVKTLGAMSRATRTRAAVLTPLPEALAVRFGEHTINLPRHQGECDRFPAWRTLVRPALEGEPNLVAEVGLSPGLLARWTAHLPACDRYTPLVVWATAPDKPVVLARGADFLGVQMPVKLDHDQTGRARVREQWTTALNPAAATAAEPSTMRAAA